MKALTQAGHEVVVYDDLSAGHAAAVPGVRLIVGDVRDGAAVQHAIRESGAGAVMHFAGRLDLPASVREPLAFYDVNVTGTLATLAAMAAEECRLFVFASSCAVYGEPKETPLDEAHPTRPINAYGQTKLTIEEALPHLERAHGMRFVALRYFNAAGAEPDGELGEDHDPEIHLIPRAFAALDGGEPLDVFGDDYPTPDGTCLRDYVHVSDLADAHMLALQWLAAGAASATLNLGTEAPSSVREVIQAVERVAGRPVPHRVARRRAGDPVALFASAQKAREMLGWRPRRSDLDTIVADAWRWRQAHPGGYGPNGAR